MRRDLVEEILADVADELFEDVLYTPAGGGAAATIEKAIAGIEAAPAEYAEFGQRVREESHVARALKSKFPTLARGDRLNDGEADYRVLDFKPNPDGDGRLELMISLKKI